MHPDNFQSSDRILWSANMEVVVYSHLIWALWHQ